MPLIRKKTSKRGTTNKRARIKGKVAESRKKQKRDAKKNVQWKSKHKKDPGIPNNFPYKDQILAEVAEQRRQAAEEKQRRKDDKKAAKTGATAENGLEVEGEGEGEQVVFDGVGSVMGQATSKVKGKGKSISEDVDMEVDEDAPILINHDLPNLQSVLDQADVVLQILDARDPLAFRSSHLEELVAAKPGRQIIFILNKIDTVPREIVTSWLAYLRTQHPTLLFHSSSAFLPAAAEPIIRPKSKEKVLANDAAGVKSILAYLSQRAEEKNGGAPLVVAAVGLTNAGKTSFINSLLGKPLLPIYTLASSSLAPTTTSLPQEVTLDVSGKQIRLVDTPGLSWLASSDRDAVEHDVLRARDILLRNKGRIDRLKDPTFTLEHIVSRADTEDLMLFYNLPAFAKNDTNAFLSGIARSKGMVKKGGIPDLAGAARIVLRDWSIGKFSRFTSAPAAHETTLEPTPSFGELYSKDEEVLSTLKTRKEMRKSIGLVKLVASHIENRSADVKAGWACMEIEEAEQSQEGDDDGENEVAESEENSDEEDEDEDMDHDGAEDDESESAEDEEPVTAPPGKRKRSNKQATMPTHSNKRVAFAADPKESKQARAAAGSAKRKASSIPKPKQSLTVSSKLKTSRIANVGTGKKTTSSSKEGEEVYDFGKFF